MVDDSCCGHRPWYKKNKGCLSYCVRGSKKCINKPFDKRQFCICHLDYWYLRMTADQENAKTSQYLSTFGPNNQIPTKNQQDARTQMYMYIKERDTPCRYCKKKLYKKLTCDTYECPNSRSPHLA